MQLATSSQPAAVSVAVSSRRDRYGRSIRRSALWVSDRALLPAGARTCFVFRCNVYVASCGTRCFSIHLALCTSRLRHGVRRCLPCRFDNGILGGVISHSGFEARFFGHVSVAKQTRIILLSTFPALADMPCNRGWVHLRSSHEVGTMYVGACDMSPMMQPLCACDAFLTSQRKVMHTRQLVSPTDGQTIHQTFFLC